jgi:hypothetical protein
LPVPVVSKLGGKWFSNRQQPFKPGASPVAHTLHPGTTMVITDLAASPETRSAPDFTVITEDTHMRGKRQKN